MEKNQRRHEISLSIPVYTVVVIQYKGCFNNFGLNILDDISRTRMKISNGNVN